MNDYELSTPRAALGLMAVAMTAVTFGVFVALPAELESRSAGPFAPAAASATTKAPNEVATSPARLGVPDPSTREAHVHPGRTTLGAHESTEKREKLSLHSRTTT